MTRIVDLATGFSAATAPSSAGISPEVTGSTGTPTEVTAAGGVTVSDVADEVIFLDSDSGAVNITANPQISAASLVGSRLLLIGTSDTDTVLFEDGDGLVLRDGEPILMEDGTVLELVWNGSAWQETRR